MYSIQYFCSTRQWKTYHTPPYSAQHPLVHRPLGASGNKWWKLATLYPVYMTKSRINYLPSDQAFNVLLPCKVLLWCMVGCMESHLKREGVIWKSDWGPWFVFRFAIPARRYPHIFPTSILTNVSISFFKQTTFRWKGIRHKSYCQRTFSKLWQIWVHLFS